VKLDIVLAGVGGQGVVSLGVVIAATAQRRGYNVKLSEVHGMAQRGGSVMATLRIADGPIHGALIPAGSADFIVATEPLEALRHLDLLSPEGRLVTASEPHVNLPNYPEPEELLRRIRALPHAVIVDGLRLAREAGGVKAANLVIVGALSDFLPLDPEDIEDYIRERFAKKGADVVEMNLRAFRAGRESACPAPA
jgi:indolepyruvate ferredoxin oxidoreductase beta subunit